MKSYAQALGVKNVENDEEKAKKESKKEKVLQHRQFQNEISTFANTILTLKEHVQALTSLIDELIK